MPRGSKKSKYIEPSFYRHPDAVYPAESIVGITDPRSPEGYSFAKLQDNVMETTDQVRVSFLQSSGDNGEDVSYMRFNEGDIKVDLILKDVPYLIENQKGRNKPQIYHIEKALFDGLAKMASVQQGATTTQTQPPAMTQAILQPGGPVLLIPPNKPDEALESGLESSDEEEEEEEEEEEQGEDTVVNLPDGTSRVFKRVKGPKKEPRKKKKEKKPKEAPAAAVGAMEEEKEKAEKKPKLKTAKPKKKKKIRQINSDGEEETVSEDDSADDEYVPDDEDKKGSGKKGKVSRATKKRAGATGEVTTKKADFSGDEGDEDEDEEPEDEEEKPKKKRGPKKKSTEKAPKAGKSKKKMPDTFKKGKFNPSVSEVSHHDLLHNPSDAIIDYGCTKTNNKNLIRAVQTKNYSLLEKILKNNFFLSTLHQQWGPENDFTALELAVRQKDIRAVKAILDCEYARTLRFTTEPQMALQNVDTGNVSKAAFGVEIRKVNVMRGGREGNNAFTHDSHVNYINLNDLFELPLDKETIEYFRLKAGNNEVFSRIDKLVLQGDRANAGHLVALANAAGGYGFNYLHEEVLLKDKASELTPNIKKVSVTKKVIGNSVITPIHCAAINPNTEILEALLNLVPDYSIPDEKMRKPVHYAACCEKPGPLKLLLSKGVDPREKDRTGLTPFMYACYYGRAENVEILMKEAQVDANYKTKDGTMGIHWAVQRGHLDVLKVLVKNGVNMTVKGGKSKMTPLHYAAAYGHFDCVKFLLENKGKVLAKDKLKRTPLSLAIRNGNLEIASYLLQHGSDYEQADSSNNYPIHYAAAYGFTECIEILVKAGANVNAKNLWNLTPLTIAMLKNNFHCVKTLFSYPETDVNAKDDNGRTLVSLLVSSLSEDNLDKIIFLVKERNCNINDADRQGMSPLHYACQLKAENFAQRDPMTYIVSSAALKKVQQIKIKLIKLLLEFGADINAKTTNNEVPMLFAINIFDSELIELLLDHKAIDLAFHDRQENNIYRLLFKHALGTDEQRKLLEKVIARAGNVGDILNEEKKPAHQQQQQNYYGHYRQMNASTTSYDPTNSNDSAFVCYKRALMNHSLEEYLNNEERNSKEAKRQQMIREQQQEQKLQLQQSTQTLGITPLQAAQTSPTAGGLFARPAQTGDLFGPGSSSQPLFSSQNNTSSSGLFGQQPAGGGGLFGDGGTGSSGGLFQSNLGGGGGGGLFGSAQASPFLQPNPNLGTAGVFANQIMQPVATGNIFNQSAATGGLFGSQSALQMSAIPQNQQKLLTNTTIKQKPIPNTADIKLTKEEIKAYKDLAHKNFDVAVTKSLLLLEKFARAGGVLPAAESSLTRDEYFHDPRFMIWVLDAFKPDLNYANQEGNTGLYSLIYKRNKLNITPSGKKFLVDYLAGLGIELKIVQGFSDFRLLLELLNRYGADFNYRNKDGVTPILYLLRDRDLANAGYLEDLIVYGADVHNAQDNKGSTPFLEAIYAYDVPVIQKLIALDVDVNHKDKAGKAPLHYIAEINAVNAMDTAKIVLKASKVEIDIKDEVNAKTPLHMAILRSARGLVKVLLNAGANPNETDKDWNNSLYFATQVGDLVLMREVSEKISDPNFSGYSGDSPLHLAIKNGKPEHVEFLLKIGANPNAKDHKGRTALMTAVMYEKIEMVRFLLQNGGNPNDRDEFDRTSLHYAVNNSKPEQMFEMEDVLIRNGALINAEDMYGRTPLHYAFTMIKNNPNYHNQNDPVETVTSLCAVKDINLDQKDRRGRRPLHYAAESGAYICILLIIKRQITLDEPDADGNTPLALALQSGHKDTAAILIQNNVNVTNMIHRINNENYLFVHPKDKNYDDVVAEEEGSQASESDEEMETAKPKDKSVPLTKKPAEGDDGQMEIETNKEQAAAEEDKKDEDDEEEAEDKIEEEEEDDVTEELDEGDARARNLETQDLGTPDEALNDVNKEIAAAEKAAQEPKKYFRGQVQPVLDSFFAISIRRGWQGIAYLLLQSGFNLMEAIKDALNEGQFRYVLALMTKIQDAVLRQIDQKQQNLFHVFAIRGHRAPSDLTTKIFDGLMMRGVDYKAVDSSGRTPLHYAAETNFLFLENALLDHKVDPNLLDNNGNNILHLALKTNHVDTVRLNKYFNHAINLNAKFWHYGREISPLHHIAERGDQRLEKEILRLGANPNIEDSQGITPLQKVFIQNNLSLDRFKVYISHYVDLNKMFTVTYHQSNVEVKKTYTLLIYAAEKGWSYFEDQLLMHGANAGIENDEGKTAFEIALAQASHELTVDRLNLYILCQAPLRKAIPCKIRKKIVNVTPVLYLLNLKTRVPNLHILKALLDGGVSVNDADQDGWTAVIYAIRRNLVFFLQLFLSCPGLDRNMRDKHGKTPIHHLINPMDYASYENVMMLELLAKYFDVNAVDDRRKAPIYYTYFQDSGVLRNALLKLGATDVKPASELQRQATSIIAGVDWTDDIDYEADAEKFIEEQELKKIEEGEVEKIPPDTNAANRHNMEVVYDDVLGPYSLFMTKVDIGKGGYGEYLFYRMQVLHDKNRDNYILFTKWGRIGDEGMYQQTPYPSKDETINEFLKIFKDKSGNEWKNKENFQKVEKKYKLLNISTKKSQRDYLKPIDYTDKKLPRSNLDGATKKLVKAVSNVKQFRHWFGRYHVDERILPFGKLSKELIFEAKSILLDLRELIEDLEIRTRKGGATDEEVQAMFKLREKIVDKSSKFYELIPDSRFQLVPVEPIDNSRTLDEKVRLVNDMLDFEVSSKILLGSHLRIDKKNPLDYCFEALNIRLLTLSKQQREYKLISEYVKNGQPHMQSDFIVNVFALERKGEAERISQWKDSKNRTYLWHGSKMLNFMGILSQGLRIAPPEAPATGYMFGKGIYFADTFAKSYGYCDSGYYGGGDSTKLLILCEVALGDSLEQFNANYITDLAPPYKSVKGCGRVGPDPAQNIVLANGAIVPIGTQMNYTYKDPITRKDIHPVLNYNEYIVYDISQVRMRYLVQVK